MFNLLEGDGVIENIYHLLWTKDSIFGSDPNVFMPHTILYKYQKPCYWYFTSKDDNKLKKKSSMKLTNEHIRDVFTRKVSKSGIVGYYIYKKYNVSSKYEIDIDRQQIKSNSNVINQGGNPKNDPKEGTYIIEYFDIKKFNDFLTNKLTLDDGILQKFEDPKGENNLTIRLIWSPKLCIFEKKTNLKPIFDTRYSVYERAVTYDGEEFQTRTEPIKGNNVPDRVEKLGNNIASHIANITLERIKIVRMVLNFKITKDDKIIFLWCSSLRIDNSLDKKREQTEIHKEPDLNKIKIMVPDNINMFKYSYSSKPIQPLKDSNCLNCEFIIESYKLYEISFKTLIESHDNRKRDKSYFKMFENINMSNQIFNISLFWNRNNALRRK
jgi:hypothetical protein